MYGYSEPLKTAKGNLNGESVPVNPNTVMSKDEVV